MYIRWAEETVAIKEEALAYDLIDFLSDIGGALGLLLGFSLYTMVEKMQNYMLISQNFKLKEKFSEMKMP